MRPVIGITTYQTTCDTGLLYVMINQAYIQALVQAGGVPVLIPSLLAENDWEEIYSRVDGILFSGGGDISLEHYSGDPHPRLDEVDELRDLLELSLFHAAVRDGKPFLGICRGIQLVNVGLGGTLYSHIPEQFPGAIDHVYPGHMRNILVHDVVVEAGTRFAEIIGESKLKVNSLHHQGLKDIAAGLRVCGSAPDGLIEAVELPNHPFGLAVQWHPENLTDQRPTRSLFQAFINAAGKKELAP
jgi:putative glutamine amidotransferase